MPNIVTGGIGFYEAGNDGKNSQYQAKATNILGGHQIRYGVQYERRRLRQHQPAHRPDVHRAERPADGDRRADRHPAEITGLGQIYRVDARQLQQRARHDAAATRRLLRAGHVAVGDRLTIRPGIRYEQQKLGRPRIIDRLHAEEQLGAAHRRDLRSCSATAARRCSRNCGRFYAKIPNDLAARALSADAGISRADYFDANLTQPIPDGVLTSRRRRAATRSATQHFLRRRSAPT